MEQQILATWAQVFATLVVGLVQCGLIAWGLWQMSQSGKRRDRAMDQQAETLGKIGQALDRQGAALERQGEVLAELLRRTA